MKDGSLQKLKERLYRRSEIFSERGKKIKIGGKKNDKFSTDWTNLFEKKPPTLFSMKNIFVAAVIFFAILLFIIFYLWGNGADVISSKNIDLDIKAPSRVAGGEIIAADIVIENKNNLALELADLIIEFPTNSFSDSGEKLERKRYAIGKIGEGGSVKKSVIFVLLGKENDEKKMRVVLEYRFENSNAIFAKEIEHSVIITQPAAAVSLSMPKEINNRQEIKIDAKVISNNQIAINNLVLKMEYPSGFQFSRAEPGPTEKDNFWQIGNLESFGQKTISVYGRIEGGYLDEKAFHCQAGTIDENGVFASYGAGTQITVIKKPYLDLSLFINAKEPGDNIVFSGNFLQGEIVWKNNLTTEVRDAVIEIQIKGKAWNEKTISVSNVFYRGTDKILIWNSSSAPDLKLIKPGDIGREKFSFAISEPLPINTSADKNFVIAIDGKITGKTISEQLGDFDVQNNVSKEIKISSFLQLGSQILSFSGPFENTGPMPPKVGKETTYTAVLSIANVSNDFLDVKVKAVLFPYARWMNKISKTDEKISFNEATGEIVWEAGIVGAGTGILSPAKEIAFQISFVPSLSQIGHSPVLLSDISIEGKDNFTANVVKETKKDLTTNLTDDSQFNSQMAGVVE